jgi:PST family polysaccharide transporter
LWLTLLSGKSGQMYDAPQNDLKKLAVSGAIATAAAQVIKLAVQFGSVILLSRLLTPNDFGVFAMVAPVYGLVLMFQDLGLSQATIQRPQITHGQLTNLFWINLALSFGLAIALALLSPLIGYFYQEPQAGALALGFAAVLILSGLSAQHLALINRQMRFGYLAVLDAGSYLAGFAAALAIALFVPTVWALFAAPVVTSLMAVVGAWIGIDWRPTLPQRRESVRDFVGFGGGLTGFNLFNFVARNGDKVLIGRVWGDLSLGLYDRAYRLLLFPLQQVNYPLSRVMVPALSRLQEEPDRYRHAYLRTLQQILLLTVPGVVFLIVTADRLVPMLLGSQWAEAAPIFRWLGVSALVQPMNSTMGWLFVSQGRTGEFMRWGAFSAATCMAAFVAGLPWGAVGVAAAYSLTEIFLRLPALWWYVTRRGSVRPRDLFETALPFLFGGGTAYLVAWLMFNQIASNAGSLILLPTVAGVSYGLMFLSLMIVPSGRRILGETYQLTAEILRRF